MRFAPRLLVAAFACIAPLIAHAGAQVEEALAPSVASGLSRAVADNPAPRDYAERPDVRVWIAQMSPKLARLSPLSKTKICSRYGR